ncbi:hypothetical protein D9Q98_002853 [Chlorella vulgaris]|uniref:Tyrosine specific protein phosphatases domain-containing protein n=1 Tax=Chlorella vulgaris TaxID=3077 RepID=A0A9D4TUB4_CHLVU|nr:hypothetical protein D9Q98_002853 [Chlorella vulgaris]
MQAANGSSAAAADGACGPAKAPPPAPLVPDPLAGPVGPAPQAAPADPVATPDLKDLPACFKVLRGVNFRDLQTVSPGCIQLGRVYRSSQVVSASQLESLNIKAVLDLRQPPVQCKTSMANLRLAIKDRLANCWGWLSAQVGGGHHEHTGAGARPSGGEGSTGSSSSSSKCGEVPPAVPCFRCTEECCEHYGVPARVFHVDMLPTQVSLRILWELPSSLQARVLWAAARRKHPEPIVAGAVADPNILGYLKLYTILLDRAHRPMGDALRIFADPANYPLLVHCIHGKDRTGLVCMLLLLLCGVDRQAVVKDYALSEGLLLEGREQRRLLGLPEHLTTNQIIASAAAVMESTIDHVEKLYGSAHNYCKHVGLSETEIGSIVRNLTGPEPLNTNAASEKL